jgi:hypothetical protein
MARDHTTAHQSLTARRRRMIRPAR